MACRTRWFGVSLGVALLALACGGESHSVTHDPEAPNAGSAGSPPLGGAGGAGSGGAAAGGAGAVAGAPDIPRLDGIPTGDCQEPTDDERQALGCPATPPEAGAGCDLPAGTTCAYSLSTNQDRAYQDLWLCSSDANRQWWLLQQQCGELCVDGGPHVLELDSTDCASRPVDACELPGTAFAYAPSNDTLLHYTLSNVIAGCGQNTVNLSTTLELVNGCPVRFSTNYDFSPTALACIKQTFESKRYACGQLLPCTTWSAYLTDL